MEKYPNVFESKILQSTCLLMAFTSLIGTVDNYILGLEPTLTLITAAMFIWSAISWWILVRYKAFKTIRFSVSILVLVIVNVVWYYNYASNGPTLGLFILLVVLFTFIWPIRKALYFIAFIILNLIFLVYIELNYPTNLLNYSSESDRIIDIYVTFAFILTAAFIFSSYAKSNYLKKYQEAMKSNEMKTIFLQNMSHELRTPLNAIIGFSDIIDEQSSRSEILSYAKTINSSGNHLLNIVEDLFDITHIESGELKIVKKDFELNMLLSKVKEIMKKEQAKINKDHLTLNLKIPEPEQQIMMYTDASKLIQILINLLKNAFKFTNEGYIDYGYKIETLKGKSVVKFFVEDSGIGIENKNKEFIFDVFSQIEGATTKSYGGAGLGLAISKKLTGLLGGQMWLESVPGKGSTFYFTIPYSDITNSDKYSENDSDSLRQNPIKEMASLKKTVLIVEDIDESYEFLRIIMDKMGICTIWAKNGEEAVEVCRKNKEINLVLMDINLPLMNGYEATQKIKAFNPDLPIIAQTAYAISGDKEKSIQVGCDDYISKPIKIEVLKAKIGKFL